MPLSTNAPFNEFGQSMILRDIEQLYLSLNASGSGSAGDGQTQDQSTGQSQESGEGGATVDLTAYATIAYVDQIAQDILDGIPSVFAMGGDVSGTTAAATVDRLKGKSLSSALASLSGSSQPDLFLWWDKTNNQWATWEMFGGTPVIGDINVHDPTIADSTAKVRTVAAGTACSVFGNSTNSAAVPGAITASTNDTILGRRSNALTWAKISTAEINDAAITKAKIENSGACSVIGRSANSTGVTADISAASDNFVLGRRSGVLTWAKVARAELADGSACSVIGRSANSTGADADIAASANGQVFIRTSDALSFTATPTLGISGTTNGSLTLAGATAATTMALACSGANATITIGNATSASAIVISPSLVTAAGRVMSVREIDVCDAGVAKKMLVLASAPY